MKKTLALCKKIEYEVPVFLILAVKLPLEQTRVYGFAYYLLCLTIALFLGGVLRHSASRERIFMLVFAALFLAGDMTKTLFTPTYADAFDIAQKAFSLLCFLAALAVLRCSNAGFCKPFFVWFVPIFCVAGALAWPSFLFFYLPVILILSAYENSSQPKGNFRFSFHATWIFPLLLACVYAVFGLYTGKKLLGFIPFPYGFKILPLRGICLAFAAALPLIVIFIVLWHLALCGEADKRRKRLLAVCMAEPAAAILLSLFAYYAVSDGWKYYIAASLFTWFCLTIYFLSAQEKPVRDAFDKVCGFFVKNPFILLAVLIYLIKSVQIFYPI